MAHRLLALSLSTAAATAAAAAAPRERLELWPAVPGSTISAEIAEGSGGGQGQQHQGGSTSLRVSPPGPWAASPMTQAEYHWAGPWAAADAALGRELRALQVSGGHAGITVRVEAEAAQCAAAGAPLRPEARSAVCAVLQDALGIDGDQGASGATLASCAQLGLAKLTRLPPDALALGSATALAAAFNLSAYSGRGTVVPRDDWASGGGTVCVAIGRLPALALPAGLGFFASEQAEDRRGGAVWRLLRSRRRRWLSASTDHELDSTRGKPTLGSAWADWSLSFSRDSTMPDGGWTMELAERTRTSRVVTVLRDAEEGGTDRDAEVQVSTQWRSDHADRVFFPFLPILFELKLLS